MKKQYMRTIIGSSGRDCVLIMLFQLYGSKTGLFEGNLFWMDQYYPPNLHIGRKNNPVLIYLNTILK